LIKIREAQVKTPVILMTAYGNTDLAIEAMKRGA
jgi:FixJ family two-component response regulator